MRAVFLAVVRALSYARYSAVRVVPVCEFTAVRELFRSYGICALRILVFRSILACFVYFGYGLSLFVILRFRIELRRAVQTVVYKRLCDASFIEISRCLYERAIVRLI